MFVVVPAREISAADGMLRLLQIPQSPVCGKKIHKLWFVEILSLWKNFVEFTKKFHKLFQFVEKKNPQTFSTN